MCSSLIILRGGFELSVIDFHPLVLEDNPITEAMFPDSQSVKFTVQPPVGAKTSPFTFTLAAAPRGPTH